MNKFLALSLLALAGSFAMPAKAADSVTVNGITFTCSNSCVVTSSGGRTTVRDCCGGRVSGTFQAPRVDE